MNRWKTSIRAMMRIAEEKAGTPEGDVARRKLDFFLARFPEARDYGPVREFTFADLGYMRRHGIPTGGRWEGDGMQDAVERMIADYRARIVEHKGRHRLAERQGITAGLDT